VPKSNVPVTAGAGTPVDTFTQSDGSHRQAMVIGDATTTAAATVVGGALSVNNNLSQTATFKTILRPAATALTANTLSLRAGLWHAASATKTIKVRTIEVNVLMSAVIEATICEVHWITAAPTGTTAVTAGTRTATAAHAAIDRGDGNPECSAAHGGTWVSAGILCTGFLAYGSAAAVHGGGTKIYDHQEGGTHKPLTFRAGQLEGLAVGLVSNAAVTPTLTVEITYTEE
jgi:hypothetical protein